MRSGTVYPLPPLARLTDAIAFSSSPTYPTPTAADYGSSNNGSPGDGREEYATKGQPSLFQMARDASWPTPLAGSNRRSRTSMVDNRQWTAPGLEQAVELASGILPRELESLEELKSPKGRAMWPTVTARDFRHANADRLDRAKERGKGPALNEAVQAESWPTPCAADGEKGGRGDLYARLNNTGRQRREQWPTPLAADAQRSGSRARPGTKGHPGVTLNEKVRADPGSTPPDGASGDAPDGRSSSDSSTDESSGQLNPTWVEWLMGFRLGWTALRVSVTLSSPTPPPSSVESSPSEKG